MRRDDSYRKVTLDVISFPNHSQSAGQHHHHPEFFPDPLWVPVLPQVCVSVPPHLHYQETGPSPGNGDLCQRSGPKKTRWKHLWFLHPLSRAPLYLWNGPYRSVSPFLQRYNPAEAGSELKTSSWLHLLKQLAWFRRELLSSFCHFYFTETSGNPSNFKFYTSQCWIWAMNVWILL